MIDEIFLDSNVARQEMRDEHLEEFGLFVKDSIHHGLPDLHDGTLGDHFRLLGRMVLSA